MNVIFQYRNKEYRNGIFIISQWDVDNVRLNNTGSSTTLFLKKKISLIKIKHMKFPKLHKAKISSIRVDKRYTLKTSNLNLITVSKNFIDSIRYERESHVLNIDTKFRDNL